MRWIKKLGLVFALPLLLALIVGLWLAFKFFTFSQHDNADHLAAKAAYLKTVSALPHPADPKARPNILLIYYDDMGYGDLGVTGSKAIKTPEIDRLAGEGVMLSHYYAPAPVCTPSRAGLLTGRFPLRAGLPSVVFPTGAAMSLVNILPGDNVRMPAEEILLPDVLHAAGYRTGMIGKWHMGDRAPSLPNNFGFDSYYGALYSNDMQPFALYRNDKIEVPAPADQTKLNDLYTNEAVNFINGSDATAGKPFFLYFAHNFPHQPLFASARQAGKSDGGLYGDVVEGLDWGVGQMVAALKAKGLYDNTIIILTSDNGPWFQGSPGFARGRKAVTFEGGMHEPFIIHWPEGIAGGRKLDGAAMGTDIMPTLMDWLSLPLPTDRTVDGTSLRSMLDGKAVAAHDFIYYFAGNKLLAVSDGRYKYHDTQNMPYVTADSSYAFPSKQGPWLFDLQNDPDESYDVLTRYPDIAKRLQAALLAKREEMKVNRRGWKG